MPTCNTTEAELERCRKISVALKGKPRGPGKPWSAEAKERGLRDP